jgi:hypothetical protein
VNSDTVAHAIGHRGLIATRQRPNHRNIQATIDGKDSTRFNPSNGSSSANSLATAAACGCRQGLTKAIGNNTAVAADHLATIL